MSARRRAAALLLSLAAPACFDVHNVAPGGVLIDDFDDGDFLPAMPELGYWQCYAYNPPMNRDYRCDHTEGFGSPYSLFVEFALEDEPDGIEQGPGAGFLSAGEGGAPIDLTPYRELVFSMKLKTGEPPIPSEARAYVELQCRTVESESGKRPPLGYFYLSQGVQTAREWSTYSLALESFGPANDTDEHIKGGAPACLRAVDGLAISIQSGLKDGRSGRGTFFIDGLSLR